MLMADILMMIMVALMLNISALILIHYKLITKTGSLRLKRNTLPLEEDNLRLIIHMINDRRYISDKPQIG
ncbi:hypothetical protein SAMN04487934_11114 [Eubacterium ruminantium]|nr:hypothetical protein SAMN04487934_11114 [Eubacterium ruminantium]